MRPSIWPLAKKLSVRWPNWNFQLAAVCKEVGDRIDDRAIRNEPHDCLDLGHWRLKCLKQQAPLQVIGSAVGR